MNDHQAGPTAAVSDLVRGKDYRPEHPFRRIEGGPGVVTGLTGRVVAQLVAGDATTDQLASALGAQRKQVSDALKGLRQRGEVEYAREPAFHTEPRIWRLVRPSPTPEQIEVAPEPVDTTPAVLPPTQQDMDDAIADLLAMHEGEVGIDPVSSALNRVLLAAEAALACYLEHFEDPLRRHLERQVEEAHAAISAWEHRRRAR